MGAARLLPLTPNHQPANREWLHARCNLFQDRHEQQADNALPSTSGTPLFSDRQRASECVRELEEHVQLVLTARH
jgi:hypothetical protein